MTGVSCRRTAAITPCRAKLTRLLSTMFRAPATWQIARTSRTAQRKLDGVAVEIRGFRAIYRSGAVTTAPTVVYREIVLSSSVKLWSHDPDGLAVRSQASPPPC